MEGEEMQWPWEVWESLPVLSFYSSGAHAGDVGLSWSLSSYPVVSWIRERTGVVI